MQISENNRVNKTMHRKVQTSVTLNRKYIKRPAKNASATPSIKRSPKIQRFNVTTSDVSPMFSPAYAPMQAKATKVAQSTKSMPMAKSIRSTQPRQTERQNQKISKTTSVASQESAQIFATTEQMANKTEQKVTMRTDEVSSAATDMTKNRNAMHASQPAHSMHAMGPKHSMRASAVSTKQLANAPVHNDVSATNEIEAFSPIAHPLQDSANAQLRQLSQAKQQAQSAPKVSAKELKDQAIQKALFSASTVNSTKQKTTLRKLQRKAEAESGDLDSHIHFGLGRVLLALSCAAVAVFAIVYFVNLSMPDISLRVAAMQTGIDPTYPNYVPRDFSISSITSESGKITMDFKNNSTGNMFTLIEENSSWDTNALASIFVKQEYGENYSIVREQGLTIYVSDSNAAWVNKGIVYKIQAKSGVLSNKQIRSIAVSL